MKNLNPCLPLGCRLLFLLFFSLFLHLQLWAQPVSSPTCNDLVTVALDNNCMATIDPDQILEGGPYGPPSDYLVEIDKTPGAPNCNGPWLPNTVGANDIGQTYCVRVTYIVNGNACWGNLKIVDNLPPTLICPNNTTVGMDATTCFHTAANGEFDPSVTEYCTATTLKYTLTPITFGNSGTGNNTLDGVAFNYLQTQVRWVATDGSGNSSSCTFTVQVNDLQPPQIACPGNLSLNTDPGQCTYTVQNTELNPLSYSENCPLGLSWGLSGANNDGGNNTLAGYVMQAGLTNVSWGLIENYSGNFVFCSFDVQVTDLQPPTITCPTTQQRNTDPGLCTYAAVATEFDPTNLSDNCPGLGIPQYVLSGGNGSGSGSLAGKVFPKASTTVIWTVTDAAGNPATCSFNVIVKDNLAPKITCPGNLTRNTDLNQCSYTTQGIEFDASGVGDNCPGFGIPQYVLSGNNGSGSGSLAGKAFPEGLTTVTWTVTDATGNPASCSFIVKVKDIQPPTISCPSPSPLMRNTNTNQCSYTTLGTEFNASGLGDNCPALGIPQYVLSGGLGSGSGSLSGKAFPKGTTTVTWTVTDASGNPNSCSISITVNDMQAPTISCPSPSPLVRGTTLNQCAYTTLGTEFDESGLGDNCPGLGIPQYLLSGGLGSGSGSLAGKAFPEGTTTVTWTVTDAAGNPASCSFLVKVKDIQPPVFTNCFSGTQALIQLSNCKVLIPNVLGNLYSTATDNCPGLTKTQFPLPGTLVNAAHNQSVPITITAKDISGNTATCIISALVKDVTPPTITTCPPNRQIPLEAKCEIIIPDLTPELIATDCTLPLTVTQNPAAGTLMSSALAQLHYVSMTVTDGAGNATICTVKLTAKAGYLAYITNIGSNTVSVINTATNTQIATIPVGNQPYGVSASRNGKRVYVANNSSGTVSVINTYSNSVIATLPISSPFGICVSDNSSKVFVAGRGVNTVYVINANTNAIIATIPVSGEPLGIAANASGSRIYVSCTTSNGLGNIAVINAITYAIITTIPVGDFPYGVCISGSRVFVANLNSGTVSVINTVSNTVTNTINLPPNPTGLCISPDGRWLYVTDNGAAKVTIVDALTLNIVQQIPTGSAAWGVSITPDGQRLYVANYGPNTVSAIQTPANILLTNIPVFSYPVAFGNFISAPTCLPPSPTDEGDEPLDDEVSAFYEPPSESYGLQAFPNPFTDNLTISFNLKTAAQVGLALFDLAGREIFQNSAVDFGAGPQSLSWNTESLPQGVYLVGLQVDGGVWQYQKAMLVR